MITLQAFTECDDHSAIEVCVFAVTFFRSAPAWIAAQILTGVGFLGAGTIFRSGGGISGLTTAAGLWVIAGIGMGIGVPALNVGAMGAVAAGP